MPRANRTKKEFLQFLRSKWEAEGLPGFSPEDIKERKRYNLARADRLNKAWPEICKGRGTKAVAKELGLKSGRDSKVEVMRKYLHHLLVNNYDIGELSTLTWVEAQGL